MKMEQPKFIKDFSKQESSEERTRLAQEIREKRTKYFDDKKSIEAKEQEKDETVKQLELLKSQIETYNDASFFVKIKDFFAIKKIEREFQSELGKQTSIEEELDKSITGRQDLDETKTMVASFYTNEKKKWAESPYSKEDIAQNFTEEHLSSLDLEDYIALLRRFPGEMVTHVTRQGLRDHYAMREHTAGYGEFQNAFKDIANDGRLRSPLGVKLASLEKNAAIAKYLNLDNVPEKEMALQELDHEYDIKEYSNKSAIHVAAEEVANAYYGSENGNEIFFAYPSAHIASQHYFSGQLEKSGNTWYNDQYLYTMDDKGLDINAGLVFIPERAKVDPRTGSQYEMGRDGKPVVNEELFYSLSNLLEDRDFTNWVKENNALETIARGTEEQKKRLEEKFRRQYLSYTDEMRGIIFNYNFLRQAIINEYEFSEIDKKRQEGIYDDSSIRHRQSMHFFLEHDLLMKTNQMFKKAENTITSKEYWEKYFAENPNKKPSKIIYYSGDPTKAMDDFKKKNGITKNYQEENFGFNENSTEINSPQIAAGMDRFKSIAKEVINDYYKNNQ
ncbi:MAG: hypothetical protein ACD_15C00196G0002 [uncultured bacterium]|nr:MAG: hypothetical protein ACD_15C00196G0002 [uncultured bacterium]